jgi:hypothetical protein
MVVPEQKVYVATEGIGYGRTEGGHKEDMAVAGQVYDRGHKKNIVMAEHKVDGWLWPRTRCMIVSTLGVMFLATQCV